MILIAETSDDIREEIADARKYALRALRCRGRYPEAAQVFFRTAREEMGHMEALHQVAESLIAQERAKGRAPTDEMMLEYERRHEKAMGEAAEVYALLGMLEKG